MDNETALILRLCGHDPAKGMPDTIDPCTNTEGCRCLFHEDTCPVGILAWNAIEKLRSEKNKEN